MAKGVYVNTYDGGIFVEKAHHTVSNADDEIVKNGFIFIKQVRNHLIDTFLHPDRAKTAGIFFIYVCFNQFLNIF